MARKHLCAICFYCICVWSSHLANAQQVPDLDFSPRVSSPAYGEGLGPTVVIDQNHFNFHTASGRYSPFAQLLRRDGFVVKPLTTRLTRPALMDADVVVIANALAAPDTLEWTLPAQSAFAPDEITTLHEWVYEGGALLLIADHVPYAGAAAELAAAFGLSFTDGYAITPKGAFDVFRRSDGSLRDHPIVHGRTAAEAIDSVMTFTGQGFRAADDAQALLVLPEGTIMEMPQSASDSSATITRIPAGGYLQGVTITIGKGRVAVFGEAAMFSAQRVGPAAFPVGMNSSGAEQNAQFALNAIHWLVGLIPE